MEHDLIVTMKLIRILSRLDSLAARIGQKHGIKLILKTMKSLPLCMQLQINCSASLANLASVEANRQSMLDEGCIKLVLQNMSKFMSSPAMQAEVCATLANLACHETNAAYIVANGGCHLIIKSMRMHTDMIDLQVQAFHALANLSRPGKDTLEREHFVGILMKSVGAHFNEVELVSAAWHALGSVAHSGINIKDSKEALASMIFDSMQRFESNPTFQITACFAIAHISFNHEGEECTPSGLAGIPVILRIMRKYPLQESLQTTAMFALGTIVMKNERYREFMLESGGIAAVLEAMRRDHSKYETKYEELAIRMASLSLGSPAGGGHSSGGSAGPLLSLDRGGIAPAVEGDSTAGSSLDSLFESDPEIEAQFEFDFQHSSETVLYSRDNTRVQCSKPLLLQLFGSVTLLNLSESAKCRDAIIDSGGVHYMFEATRRVSDHLDLWFIVYYIFTKFTKCGDERVLYMRRKG
ncbi:armadillo-type protein [Entophlyctis helioformis]|nr:armadillo-type protein [Entophlyctis helioformis]